MEKAKVEVTVVKTDKGNIRIEFDGGGSYLIPDIMPNIGIISAFEIELKYAVKKSS